MQYLNNDLLRILQNLDLGASVAEIDTLLETARIETSAFNDLINDRVDLVPGTKGSGKSALFRIFIDFLPKLLLDQRKIVVAHGVDQPGDDVFHAFKEQFEKLTEEEFVSFWCIYLVSLAHEQFIKNPEFKKLLKSLDSEIQQFQLACEKARIPEIKSKKSLRDILNWSLQALSSWRPKVKATLPALGELELDLFGNTSDLKPTAPENTLPEYVNDVRKTLEAILKTSNLTLWLMVDRLDEIFPRRSELELKALRGLLRAIKHFSSQNIRVKLFLRDDMLAQVVSAGDGFTALTHITARQADTLRWNEEQIQAMIVKRFAANQELVDLLGLNLEKINASAAYREECFDKIFPPTVHKGSRQSKTIRWICNRCADGCGVVTPRDVLDLLLRAKQKQMDIFNASSDGSSEWVIDSAAIQYGFEELSKRKRDTYLKAEFPHLWKDIEKFIGGKTDYGETAIKKLLGLKWKETAEDLISIGFLIKSEKAGKTVYSVPYLYRHAMNVTQGTA